MEGPHRDGDDSVKTWRRGRILEDDSCRKQHGYRSWWGFACCGVFSQLIQNQRKYTGGPTIRGRGIFQPRY